MNYLIIGRPASGKTIVLNKIKDKLEALGQKVYTQDDDNCFNSMPGGKLFKKPKELLSQFKGNRMEHFIGVTQCEAWLTVPIKMFDIKIKLQKIDDDKIFGFYKESNKPPIKIYYNLKYEGK